MMDIKRTLSEVLTLYELEPDLKDLFVEGSTDKSFIEWYLRAGGITSVTVYSIGVVDIPDDVLLEHGLPTGSNRSRVLALACELSAQHPMGLRVLCLADRDFEDYRPSEIDKRYVLFTDGNALDLYAFTPSNMLKFTAVALGGLRAPAQTLMALLTDVLQQVFAVRLANELLGWGMEWVPFARYVEIEGATVSLRRDALIRAYLQKNGRWPSRQEFADKVDEVFGLLSTEATRKMRGHDLGELLLRVIRGMSCKRRYFDVETLEGSLMAAVDRRDLEKLPFFQRISEIAGT